MALRAAAHMVLVSPTGDDHEEERGGLIVVNHHDDGPETRIFRGVVLHVGVHVPDPIEPGNVVHYTQYARLGERHLVAQQAVLAYEDDE